MQPSSTPAPKGYYAIVYHGVERLISEGQYKAAQDVIRQTLPDSPLTDAQIDKLAGALAAKNEAAARAERPRQRRREWMLVIISLIAGALLSIPIGILVNLIS